MARFSVVFQFETRDTARFSNSLDLASNGRIDSYEVSGRVGSLWHWKPPAGLAQSKPPFARCHYPLATVTGSADGNSRSDTDHSLSLAWEAAFQRHKHNYS
jgi:hypothetical protein